MNDERKQYLRWVIQSVFEGLKKPMSLDGIKQMFDGAINALMIGEQPTHCFGCGVLLGRDDHPVIWHGSWIIGSLDKGIRGRIHLYHCGDCAPEKIRRTVLPDEAFGFEEGLHEAWKTIHGKVKAGEDK